MRTIFVNMLAEFLYAVTRETTNGGTPSPKFEAFLAPAQQATNFRERSDY